MNLFYTPAQNANVAKGKLYAAYTKYKQLLRAAKIIQLRSKTSSIKNVVESDELHAEPPDETTMSIDEMLEFLKVNAGPFELVFSYWTHTRETRMKMLEENSLSTHDYLEKFRGLNTTDGFKLVNVNAKHLIHRILKKYYFLIFSWLLTLMLYTVELNVELLVILMKFQNR